MVPTKEIEFREIRISYFGMMSDEKWTNVNESDAFNARSPSGVVISHFVITVQGRSLQAFVML